MVRPQKVVLQRLPRATRAPPESLRMPPFNGRPEGLSIATEPLSSAASTGDAEGGKAAEQV